jgi:hypothetical protein
MTCAEDIYKKQHKDTHHTVTFLYFCVIIG